MLSNYRKYLWKECYFGYELHSLEEFEMKILHLADLHLGKIVLGLSMIDDQRHVLNQALDLCKREHIKVIIISGDVYDRSIPPEEAVTLLNSFLSKAILEDRIQVYVISGNHDSKERLSCFNGLLEKAGLFIDASINKDLSMNKHVIEQNGLKVCLYSLPYIFPGEIRLQSDDPEIKDFEKAVTKVIESNSINESEINILNAHYFVTGNEEPIRSDSESKTSVGTMEQISYSVFYKFDYVALGHLHCPQHIGREHVRYAGSPLKYSIDEITQNKCFTVININSKKDIQIEKIEIRPLHDFVCLEGSVEELTNNSEQKDMRITFFKLTDADHVLNAAARLKIKYPNYVALDYININSNIEEGEGTLEKVEGFSELSPDQQFDKFFNFINEKDMNEIQKKAIKDAFEKLDKEEN